MPPRGGPALRAIRQLECLGHKVTLEPLAKAA